MFKKTFQIVYFRTYNNLRRSIRSLSLSTLPCPSSKIDNFAAPAPNAPEQSKESEETMSAWQVYSFGGLDKLQLAVVKAPIIKKPTDVLIKIKAASVNPLDVAMIGGYGNVMLDTLRQLDSCLEEKLTQPLILGRDFTGEVIAKGNKVRPDIMIGDTVYGVVPPHMPGCHADKVIADETLICRKPDFLGVNEAASVMYTGITAWSALKITGDLCILSPYKKRVLVIGSAGGVGSTAVQLLKAWGSEVVATCRPDAIPMVQNLKPDAIIDYTTKEALRDIKYSGKYDIILDASGTANPATYIPFLKDWSNSKFITLRSPMLKNTDSHGLMVGMVRNMADIVMSNVSSGAPAKGCTVRWGFFMPVPPAIKEISDLVEAQKVVPVVQEVFPFSDLPAAYKKVSEGHMRGKIVISMANS